MRTYFFTSRFGRKNGEITVKKTRASATGSIFFYVKNEKKTQIKLLKLVIIKFEQKVPEKQKKS